MRVPTDDEPAPSPALSLADVLQHYRSVAESTHKFWSYFQIVAVGIAAFAWSTEKPHWAIFGVISLAFLAFVRFNGALVLESQREAWAAAEAVKLYATRHDKEVPTEFRPIIDAISPKSVDFIRGVYAWLTVGTIATMWGRLLLRCLGVL
jgi:hypothetical protein